MRTEDTQRERERRNQGTRSKQKGKGGRNAPETKGNRTNPRREKIQRQKRLKRHTL